MIASDRKLCVFGISVVFTFVIFVALQLLATFIRLFVSPSIFDVKGSYGALHIPYYLVGDALFAANIFAFFHAFLVALGYGVWLRKQASRRNLENKPKGEEYSVVPHTLYGSILGFCIFGALGFAVHLPSGDFDLVSGAIFLLMPFFAPLGMVVGWRATLHLKDGLHPDEANLGKVFLRWSGVAIGLEIIVHSIVFWLH